MSLNLRLLPPGRTSSPDLALQPGTAGQENRARQSLLILALLAAVVVLDQAVKWWAWRNFSWTVINSGGDILVGPTIGGWYAGPVTGALLDLLDVSLLSIGVWVLARWQFPASVAVPGVLATGGWGSNLLDRLGAHYWTAPGSVRGVVDFMHIGGHFYNVADFFIIGCTPLFLMAAVYQGARAVWRPVPVRSAPPPARGPGRIRALIPALAGAVIIVAVAVGAVNYDGVNAAPPHPRAQNDRHACSVAPVPLRAC